MAIAGDPGASIERVRAFSGAPRLPRELVHRERLLRLLDGDSPLVIVRGMGGSGKTVLMAHWARRRADADAAAGSDAESGDGKGAAPETAPGQWVSLRRQATTRSGFWGDVVEALVDSGIVADGAPLRRVVGALDDGDAEAGDAGRAGDAGDAEAPDPDADALGDPRAALVRAFARLPRGVHLVVDNYERVGSAEVHHDLLDVLQHCPRVHVTLATRSLNGLDDALVPARVDAEEVGPELLAFDDAEVAELMRLSGFEPTPGTVHAVLEATGGLALPVRAAVGASGRDLRVPRAVVTYVADTISHMAGDDRTRAFLLQTSVPEAVTVELARLLTDDDEAERMLDTAESDGLGLWSTGSDDAVFRYSTVVRQALLSELTERFAEELPRLRLRHAEWARAHGLGATALAHAVEAGDLDFASRIVQEEWAELLESGLGETVAALRNVPLHRIRSHPLLAMMLALGLHVEGDHPMRAIELFTLAIAAARVRSARTEPVERFVLAAGESTSYRLTGRTDLAGRSAERALAQFEALSPTEREELRRNTHHILAQLGISLFYSGESTRALAALSSAFSAAALLHGQRAQLHPLALIAGARALLGEMNAVDEPVARLETMDWPEGWLGGYPGAFYLVARAYQALERFDFVEAQRLVDTVQTYTATHEHRGVLLGLQALIDLGTRHQREGAVRLQRALEASVTPALPRLTRDRLATLLALQQLGSGREARAASVLAKLPADAPWAGVARALVALLGEAPAEALRQLNGLQRRPDGGDRWAEGG
ncbi:MAG: hypothetical protein Q7T71_20555, partial [Herbiconiux sp.]|nr:hypothetical protein [Herbiconiux sp.]